MIVNKIIIPSLSIVVQISQNWYIAVIILMLTGKFWLLGIMASAMAYLIVHGEKLREVNQN